MKKLKSRNKIEELKRETQALQQKRRDLHKRLREEKERYQAKAHERLLEINTILNTKNPQEIKENVEQRDPFDFLETQSDNGDILSVQNQNDPFGVI